MLDRSTTLQSKRRDDAIALIIPPGCGSALRSDATHSPQQHWGNRTPQSWSPPVCINCWRGMRCCHCGVRTVETLRRSADALLPREQQGQLGRK
jgi:hypothetical protein